MLAEVKLPRQSVCPILLGARRALNCVGKEFSKRVDLTAEEWVRGTFAGMSC